MTFWRDDRHGGRRLGERITLRAVLRFGVITACAHVRHSGPSLSPVPAAVRIAREDMMWMDGKRKYSVEIDGKVVGAVHDGEIQDFSVAPGYHTLRLRIDWTGSVESTFLAGESGLICFRCKPRFPHHYHCLL